MKPEKEIREEIIKKVANIDVKADIQHIKAKLGSIVVPSSPIPEEEVELKEELFRLSRGAIKTAGRLVGRNKENTSLFSIQAFIEETEEENLVRYVTSKNTQRTLIRLLELYQKESKDKNGYIEINNLSSLARDLDIEPREIKNHLLYLSAFVYPVIHCKEKKGNKNKLEITTSIKKPLDIEFVYIADKTTDLRLISNDMKVGTRLGSYIKNAYISKVRVKPNLSFIEEIEGKGLGNILTSTSIIKYTKDLSPMAFKLFMLTGGNKPYYKIGFNKLVKNLDLETAIYGRKDKDGKRVSAGQGKPYILEKLKEAFKELKDKGHIEKWSWDNKKQMFSWKYTNKVFKHKELCTLSDKVYTYGDKEKNRNNNKEAIKVKKRGER